MCNIIFKPLGVKPPDDYTFLTADDNNPDGWGIMARVNGEVVIERYFGDNSGIKLVEAVKKYSDVEYVVHTRIGTSGTIGIANTHPFHVWENVWMVHNGIIKIDRKGDTKYCDSYHYAKHVGNQLTTTTKQALTSRTVQEDIASHIGFSKLVFFDDERTTIINEAKYDAYWRDGCWFSNDTAHRDSFSYGSKTTWPSVGYNSNDEMQEWWKDVLRERDTPSFSQNTRNQAQEDATFEKVLAYCVAFKGADVDTIVDTLWSQPEMAAEVIVHLMSQLELYQNLPAFSVAPLSRRAAKRKRRRDRLAQASHLAPILPLVSQGGSS